MVRRGRSTFVLSLAFMLVPAWVPAVDVAELAERVTVEGIRRHVMVLGSDALEGRGPGSPGGDRAAGYIASEIRALGLRPLGDDGGFLQQVPLLGSRPLPGCRLTLTTLGVQEALTLGDDYVLITTGEQTLVPRPTPVVFVGYGIVAPEFDYNDYADVDVRGKVVVYLEGEPRSADPGYFLGEERSVYAAVETKIRTALARGAVGSVMAPRPEQEGSWWLRQRRASSFEHVTAASAVPRHLAVILHPERVGALFAEALYDLDAVLEMDADATMRSFHLPVQLAFEGEFESRSFLSPNVVAVLDGSDPELRDTFVVVSAHYDHLGRGTADDDDEIHNGVVDNALGVAGALEIARVTSELRRPPRRSLLFLFSTAEEKGNLGASYFLDHSQVAPPKMVANVNIDGLAFLDTFTTVVGIGAELSDLGAALERAARPLGLSVTPTREVMWSHEAFARSEQAAFARAGVPSILLVEGLSWRHESVAEASRRVRAWFETRYHRPGDDLGQPLDLEASRQLCQAALALVWTVAESPRAPMWHPGVPYSYERLLSLAGHER